MSIAALLQQSREAHLRYRENIPRRVSQGDATVVVDGDQAVAGAALVDAIRWRAEAHVLDPQRADPAWLDESFRYGHDGLLGFYVEQLTR